MLPIAVNYASVNIMSFRAQLQRSAYEIVQKAIKAGKLVDLVENEIACVDCGERARTYDHRDYARPLDVEPVCHKCNAGRGEALPPWEPLAERKKPKPHTPRAPKHGLRSTYTNHGCRCEPCSKANRDYSRPYMARKRRKKHGRQAQA